MIWVLDATEVPGHPRYLVVEQIEELGLVVQGKRLVVLNAFYGSRVVVPEGVIADERDRWHWDRWVVNGGIVDVGAGSSEDGGSGGVY